jgi:hypothetical protein
MSPTVAPFRFDRDEHEYWDLATGALLPHITEMLERTGWREPPRRDIEEARDRGSFVHRRTADYDLGLDVDRHVGPHAGYVRAYVAIVKLLRPVWEDIEVPRVHPHYRYGGRPDRVGTVLRLRAVAEIKTGTLATADPIQTALQAILVSGTERALPPASYARFGFYLKPTGKFKVERFDDPRDYDHAYEVIRLCCGA